MAYVGDLMRGEWNYINTLTAPPSTGQLRMNSATQNLATLMWVHKTTANSVDATNFLTAVKKDHEVYFQDKDDATKWQAYKVTAAPTNSGTYMTFPIVWTRGNGIVPQQRAIFVILPGGAQDDYAYPSTTPVGTHLGVTVKQYYATEAMIGFITGGVAQNLTSGQLAEWSFQVAESMVVQDRMKASGINRPPAGTPKRNARGARQTAINPQPQTLPAP